MEKKYINESRYKKGTTRKRRDATTVRSNLRIKKESKTVVDEKNVIKNVTLKSNKSIITKKKSKKKVRKNKRLNIFMSILLIILIAIISRLLLKEKDEPFISLTFGESEAENNQVIKIGIISTQSLLDENNSNVVVIEFNKYSKDMLLTINEDYSINYGVISSVTKVSNTEYIITKNNSYTLSINRIKNVIDKYASDEKSIYYSKLNNVVSTTVLDNNNMNIKLKTDDPYFIYNLEIPCDTTENTNYIITSATDQTIIFNRSVKADKQLPAKIVITKYKDVYGVVEAYKSKQINCFVTNAQNIQTLLGKYEYNISGYRNGKCVFLFGNSKSKVFSKLEVRQVLAYSINRDGVIHSVLNSKGSKIDLPYIYDNSKYKYDIYAAENILLTNGYTKTNKVYSKKENGEKITLELDLIVNKEDDIKVNIAKQIKNNLDAIGIKINIEELAEKKMKTKIDKGDYDLLLANINLNNNPNITFLQNNLFISDNIEQALIKIGQLKEVNQNQQVNTLLNILSNDISTIGIYSDISYVISNKEIELNNISYMNLFKSLFTN